MYYLLRVCSPVPHYADRIEQSGGQMSTEHWGKWASASKFSDTLTTITWDTQSISSFYIDTAHTALSPLEMHPPHPTIYPPSHQTPTNTLYYNQPIYLYCTSVYLSTLPYLP
jgi:hypothetical protein